MRMQPLTSQQHFSALGICNFRLNSYRTDVRLCSKKNLAQSESAYRVRGRCSLIWNISRWDCRLIHKDIQKICLKSLGHCERTPCKRWKLHILSLYDIAEYEEPEANRLLRCKAWISREGAREYVMSAEQIRATVIGTITLFSWD